MHINDSLQRINPNSTIELMMSESNGLTTIMHLKAARIAETLESGDIEIQAQIGKSK